MRTIGDTIKKGKKRQKDAEQKHKEGLAGRAVFQSSVLQASSIVIQVWLLCIPQAPYADRYTKKAA